jgi:hypothetical protein
MVQPWVKKTLAQLQPAHGQLGIGNKMGISAQLGLPEAGLGRLRLGIDPIIPFKNCFCCGKLFFFFRNFFLMILYRFDMVI